MADVAPSLDQLRAEIDQIDDALVRLLGQRVEIGRRVAAAKGDATGPYLRPGREAAILGGWSTRVWDRSRRWW